MRHRLVLLSVAVVALAGLTSPASAAPVEWLAHEYTIFQCQEGPGRSCTGSASADTAGAVQTSASISRTHTDDEVAESCVVPVLVLCRDYDRVQASGSLLHLFETTRTTRELKLAITVNTTQADYRRTRSATPVHGQNSGYVTQTVTVNCDVCRAVTETRSAVDHDFYHVASEGAYVSLPTGERVETLVLRRIDGGPIHKGTHGYVAFDAYCRVEVTQRGTGDCVNNATVTDVSVVK